MYEYSPLQLSTLATPLFKAIVISEAHFVKVEW